MSNISLRIKELREAKNWNQKELAAKLGIRQSAISAWENDLNGPTPTQRKKLCEVFNISMAEFYDVDLKAISHLFPIQKIPVISWVHANKFGPIEDQFPAGVSDEYVYSAVKGKNIFALRVQNDCMIPEFQEGDIIIVNPHLNVDSGDYVIVSNRDSYSATFKQLKKYGNKVVLHPLNPRYQDIELDSKKRYIIIGKVVEKIKKY